MSNEKKGAERRRRDQDDDETPQYPCQFCDNWETEGCMLSDFPKYGRRCKVSAKKKSAEWAARDNARAELLGMFRNKAQNWCIKHPKTGRVVSSGYASLQPAVMRLSKDQSIGMEIRSREFVAEKAERRRPPKAKQCEKPTTSDGTQPVRKRAAST